MLALLAAVSAFVAFTSAIAWAFGVLQDPVGDRLTRLSSQRAVHAAGDPFATRVAIPVLHTAVSGFVSILPHRMVDRIGRQLATAGSTITTQAFFTTVLLCGIGFPASVLLLIAYAGGDLTAGVLLLIAAVGVLGVFLPFVWLRSRARKRRTAIWRSLPDACDMITLCVEAGLGLDAALRRVSMRLHGPLSDEVNTTLREIGLGRPRREALEAMATRIDVPQVTTFVHSIIQAEQLGTSLGRTLRSQAVTLRTQRRQKAEEVARRAPVKMVFPLVLFIMPTFFIITLGPLVVHFFEIVND